jgi:hypothetical protein
MIMPETRVNIKSKTQQYLERLFFGLVIIFLFTQVAQAGKIIKWTDEQGVVHYGDVMPAKAAGKRNTELNKEGVVVKENKQYQRAVEDEGYSDQLRKDRALLASYSSVTEIELALQRNVGAEENLLNAMDQRLAEVKQALATKLTKRQNHQLRKQAVPKYLQAAILADQKKFETIKGDITAKRNNIALIKTRFASYKARYTELRPRNQSLSAINVNRKNLTDLESWKRKANETLSDYLQQTVKYKRAGEPVPTHIVTGIQKANQEIARADQQIASIRASIRHSQQTFTSK